jgi:hypothetical protein
MNLFLNLILLHPLFEILVDVCCDLLVFVGQLLDLLVKPAYLKILVLQSLVESNQHFLQFDVLFS